ncbi:MAG: hypothetical protein IKD58_16595 [Loktanella sp.]|nr:hypothetical protein [Loktanella sp.]
MSEEFLFLVVFPTAAFAAATALSFWFGRLKTQLGLWSMAVVWLGFTVAMIFGLEQATGWDGLVYVFGLLFLALPAGLGALIGGIIGWKQKENLTHA